MNAYFKSICAAAALLGFAETCQAATLKFDGVDDYVRIEDNAQFDVTTNYTLECWFKAETLGGLRGLISKFHTGNSYGYLLRLNGSNLDFDQMITSGLNLQTGVWYHVSAVNSNSTRHLYLNGQEQALTGTAYAVLLNNDPICLGRDYLSAAGRVLNGQMDEVRIWNVARTAAEVANSLGGRLAGNEPGLVAYYILEEGAGATTADMTGHGNTGSLMAGALWNPVEDALTPLAKPVPASSVTGTSALLGGWVNTNGVRTTNYFDWGAGVTALAFDGLDDSVVFPTNFNVCPLTVGAWIKTARAGSSGGVVNQYVSGSVNGWNLRVFNGRLRAWYFRNGSNYVWDQGDGMDGGSVDDGLWHHVAFTVSSNQASGGKLYVDGVLRASRSWTGTPGTPTTAEVVRLGVYYNEYLAGQISGVTIWQAEFDAAAITELMRAPPGPAHPQYSSLMADWRLEGNFLDARGLIEPGVPLNRPGWAEGSRPVLHHTTDPIVTTGTNMVLNLDGFDDHLRVPAGAWFSNEFTVECWVYERSYNNWARVLDFGNGAASDNVLLALTEGTSGRPYFQVFRGNAGQGVGTPYPLPLNQWVHLAATLKSGQAAVYVNGVAVASGAVSPPNAINRNNNFIGRSNWGTDSHANALFEDLRIWKVARTADQIRQYMRQPVTSSDPDLVLDYRFDATSGSGTAVNGASLLSCIPVTATLTNLEPGRVYGFRPVAQASSGTGGGSPDRFATLSPGGGTALEFDGVNDLVSVPDAPSLDLTTNLTFEAWVKFRQVTRTTDSYDWQCFFAKSVFNSSFGLMLCTDNADKTLRFYHSGASPAQSDYRWTDVMPDRWYHVAATLGGGSARLYIDGALKATTPVSGSMAANALPLLIGYSTTGGYPFDGQMDEVRIWNKVRSEDEIRQFMNERLDGVEPNLVAYYRLDEGAGTMAVDATTNTNHGLLVEGPLWMPSYASVDIPIATTAPATFLSRTQVKLNGLVNPAGTGNMAWFQWGAATNYGQTTLQTNADSVTPVVDISAEVSALAIGVVCHYRLVTSNSVGISYGADQTFVMSEIGGLGDSGAGSLRQAIATALPGTILIMTNNGTITLTSGELSITRDLTIVGPGAANLAINGNNASRVFNIASNVTVNISGITIQNGHAANGGTAAAGASGGGIYNAGNLTLSECVVVDNHAGDGGAGYNGGTSQAGAGGGKGGDGGGICNASGAVLTLQRCAINRNSAGNGARGGDGGHGLNGSISNSAERGGNGGAGGAGGTGGGIYGAGTVTLEGCTLSSNNSGFGGGGGNAGGGGDGGTWRYDADGGNGGAGGAGGDGGAALELGQLFMTNCTLSANNTSWGGNGGNGGHGGSGGYGTGYPGSAAPGGKGGSGGGIASLNHLEVFSCTVLNNLAGAGGSGGTWPYAVVGTQGGQGGGVASLASTPVTMANTIVAQNNLLSWPLYNDVQGAFASLGCNLLGRQDGGTGFKTEIGDLLGVLPLAGPLIDNGSGIWTHALWPESPAVNAGSNIWAAATDQNGNPRIACGRVDIGAVEYGGCPQELHPAALRALYFDGVDDSVQGGAVTLSNCSFTIEAWAKRDYLNSGDCILGQGKYESNRGLVFGFKPDNRFTFAFVNNDLETANPYTDGDWHHWAGTYDTNGQVRLVYRDGVLVASNTAAADYAGSGTLFIGIAAWNSAWPFDGELDEVRVWRGARTEEQIRQNRCRALAGNEPGLLAYYRFDEGEGSTTLDVAGGVRRAINGASWVTSGSPLYQPIARTLPAEAVRSTTAILRGMVNPAGTNGATAWFEYGTSPYLGANVVAKYLPPGIAPEPISLAISNLESGTKYYYRLAANNSLGTVYGEILAFDTLVVGSGYPIATRANNGQSTISPRHVSDAEGNIYLAGQFSGSIQLKETLQAAGSSTNSFLAKLARRGDWRWAVNIPITNGMMQIRSVALTSPDAASTPVLVAGCFSGTAVFGSTLLASGSRTLGFVAKYDPVAPGWAWANAIGGGATNSVNAVAVGKDGRIFIAGQFSGTNIFGPVTLTARGASDAFFARMDDAGLTSWATQAGGQQAQNHDSASALVVGPFGELHVTGLFRDTGQFGMNTLDSAGGADLFFATVNPTNGLIQKSIRAGAAGDDTGTALATDRFGNIYLAAQLEGAANFDGAPLPELESAGMNLVVAQLNRQGVLSRRAAARAAWADSLTVGPKDEVWLAGDFTGVMHYGPTLTTVGTGTNASSDVFVAQLTQGGSADLNWTDFKQIGGIGAERRGSVSVDPAGSVVVSGTFAQSLHVGYVELSTPNTQEIFVARIDPDGSYEHNRWEIGQALIPPDEALIPPFERNQAKGLLSIELLAAPAGLTDSDAVNSFLWNDTEKRLYAVRPVTARIKWRLDENLTNLANVATMVGRCYWPDHPITNVAGAPVEVQGPGVGLGLYFAGVAFNTNGASIMPVTRGERQFQVFQTGTNASGFNVIHYTTEPGAGKSVFDVVYTRPYTPATASETLTANVGESLTRGSHEDSTGKNGYVFYERSFYDALAHDRAARSGPILPVNRNLHSDPSREMVVVWYRTNAASGVAWGSDPVRYNINWAPDAPQLVIAAIQGVPTATLTNGHVYHQPDANLPGFNPNEEHAFISGDQLFALRCDLNDSILPKASEAYVLVKHLGKDSTNDWLIKVFKIVAEDATHTFAHLARGVAGLEIQPPLPLSLLPLCASSNRIAFGESQAHLAWNGKLFAKSAGYFQVQYWYPTQPDFYFGATNPPVGSCVPWLSQYAQTPTSPGATRLPGKPVLVGYDISWPTNAPALEFAETLTTRSHGLPDLLSFASARVIYDDGSPGGTNWADSLVRVFDPLSERTIQLSNTFKLPTVIATANDRGRLILTDLPYPIRIRLFYDPLNQRLSFGGWYDPEFGTGEPLLLPNILSPRERDRIKQLADTEIDQSLRSAFISAIDKLYDLTRNPNCVDVNGDNQADKELRVGLITQIREGFDEILAGPVIPGPLTNFVTWRTNRVVQPVSARVTNIVQEQFGDLPKALTAGLRPGAGYVTIVENDDSALPGQPIGLHVIFVTNSLFRGDLKVLPSDNVFDQRVTLRHSADFGGEPQNYEFEWYYQPDQNGVSPPFPVLAAGQTNWNGWIRFPIQPAGTTNGYNDFTLGEGNSLSSLLVLCDNWLICRYRAFTNDMPTQWSAWVGAPGGDGGMLAQGWIKRVISGLNEFDSRTRDFHETAAATYASMILQAGQRYEGPIAFNPDPDYLNSVGLIESYQTVLNRARNLSIDGAPPVNFGPANNALLRAAGKVADLYMLIGNEAYADTSDPTIGFTTASGEYGNLAPSIFCFQNQLDSPIEEELALLRGRDDSGSTVKARPYYNRLLPNFTLGDGEVAYKLTYNISDQNSDGFINEKDARVLFPQGHGDAWGHYLTAISTYYDLLRHPNFEWVPRAEAVDVGGSPVQVDYLDERKFAQAAAAKAKAGAEIVNLTYRQKYVDDPSGQWQGYKDTQTDRAWGVSEWAARAGAGAYFDWVVANALLPATDPNPGHVGIQKIDRTTVAELSEIPVQFAAIETQLDTVDRGLNPLGLATGAMPFDIDPSKVAAGQTHFDQVYERATKAMANTLALFDHVNTLSQSLRRTQDEVDQFSGNVEDQERDFRNRMIELFGYPYAGDIGPAGTYPSGYDGPDIYHYMYVNASELTGTKIEPDKLVTGYYKPLQFPGAGLGLAYFPGDVDDTAQSALAGDGTFHVSYPMVENGAYLFQAPAAWASRRAPGKIQNTLSEMLKARAQLSQGILAYDNLRKQIQDEIELLGAQSDLAATKVLIRTRESSTLLAINVIDLIQSKIKENAAAAAQKSKDMADATAEGIPKAVGLANDVGAPARSGIKIAGNIASFAFTAIKLIATGGEAEAENAKLILETQTALGIECATDKFEIAQRAKVIEQLCREEVARRVEIYGLQENAAQTCGAYLATLAEGQRLIEERFAFRVKTAAQVQEYRYQDMAFRIFKNDALQKYRAQFDLAARYVYLAAKAYDYETCLLNTDTGAGSRLLTDIVRQRTLGQLVNGLPVSGCQGLADPLARLGQNFEVYRGQLGFSTPETETGRFSLRSELMRIRPGNVETNALNGLLSTNQDWNALLQQCRVPDLWKIPEFRRFCRPFAPESAGPQPGIVIRIPTTITFGLNYFGWPLGPGDSTYDSSRFATKIRSAGVWFSDYNLAGLSMTPRVYFVPAGIDIMRSPSSRDLKTREFNVVDQKLPVPFPIGATDLGDADWIPVNDSLSETFGDIRRFSSFRAYHDKGWFDENEATQDTRLIGRSVWNTEWLLIIPGGTFLYDPNRGLDTFVATVGDIKIFFQTYSYSGN